MTPENRCGVEARDSASSAPDRCDPLYTLCKLAIDGERCGALVPNWLVPTPPEVPDCKIRPASQTVTGGQSTPNTL